MKIADVTEIKIGSTIFTITAECSNKATETVEQKLKRLILGSVNSGDIFHETYRIKGKSDLAMNKTLR